MKNIVLSVIAASALSISGVVTADDALADAQPTSSKAQVVEQCDAVKAEFSALQEQLPVQIDYMTSITGMSAIMGTESCLISFVYSSREDIVVDEVVKGAEGELTEDQALAFLQSNEGRNVLKTTLKAQAEAIFEDLGSKAPGLRYHMTYHFDGLHLNPITINFH